MNDYNMSDHSGGKMVKYIENFFYYRNAQLFINAQKMIIFENL